MLKSRPFLMMLVAFAVLHSSQVQAGQRQETYFGNRHAAGQYAYGGKVPSEIEINLYQQQSPTPCEGPHAQQAVEVGLSHHWKWVVLYRTEGAGHQATRRAFDDSWQALRYLIEDLNCEDPLVQYRYGNSIHMQRDYERSAVELGKAIEGIRNHYPQMLPIAQSQYAEALNVTGHSDDAIAQNRQVLELIPDSVSAMLNLASRLSQRLAPGDADETRALLIRARDLGVSDYGLKVIEKIEARLSS